MSVIAYEGVEVNVDEDGFLIRPEDWTERLARVLAEREGIRELSEEQLDILRFMRQYYQKYQFFPIVRFVCKNVGQPSTCITDKFTNPVTAWKIAGLPNPGEEVRTFQSWNPLGY